MGRFDGDRDQIVGTIAQESAEKVFAHPPTLGFLLFGIAFGEGESSCGTSAPVLT